MEESVTVLNDWPPIATVAMPVVYATDTSFLLRYRTPDDQTAIVRFPLVSIFTFGSPNDEALNGHPLYRRGLKFYSVHRVDNSSWVSELERRNSVHPQHNKRDFLQDKVHYVLTFQDSTLECVVTEGEFWPHEIRVCTTEEEAAAVWEAGKKGKLPNHGFDHER